MDETELEYLRRRGAEEMAMFKRSRDPVAVQFHRRLAILYANRVSKLNCSRPIHVVHRVPA